MTIRPVDEGSRRLAQVEDLGVARDPHDSELGAVDGANRSADGSSPGQDPLTPFSLAVNGVFQWTEGLFDDALSTARQVIKLDPDFTPIWLLKILALASRRKYSEVTSVVVDMKNRGLQDPLAEFCAFFESGLPETETEPTVLSEEALSYLWNDPEVPWFVAQSYSLRNDKEEALRWLERVVERDWINYPLWKNDVLMENVRGEPRYQELMAGVKRRWEDFGD